MPFALTWLPKVLLDAGLKVAEQPGWQNRGRGEMGPVKGVICHHTAGPLTGNMPSLRTVEAENTGFEAGPKADPWPEAQMDAYRRGVAAILKKVRANAIMCCGHKEYALPHGRKNDPTFKMGDFRARVAAIMAGAAPLPSIIPATDGEGRPTLRRGDTGDSFKEVQKEVGVGASGTFDGDTEAAVRQFQREHDLVPDGIVGPRTWAALLA